MAQEGFICDRRQNLSCFFTAALSRLLHAQSWSRVLRWEEGKGRDIVVYSLGIKATIVVVRAISSINVLLCLYIFSTHVLHAVVFFVFFGVRIIYFSLVLYFHPWL